MRTLLRQTLNLDPSLAESIAPMCDGSPGRAMLLVRDLATRSSLSQKNNGTFTLDPLVSLDDIQYDSVDELSFLSRIRGAVDATESPNDAYEALAATALAGQEPPALVVREINPQGPRRLARDRTGSSASVAPRLRARPNPSRSASRRNGPPSGEGAASATGRCLDTTE